MFDALYRGCFVNYQWLLLALEDLPCSEENTQVFVMGMFESIKFLVTASSERREIGSTKKLANED